MTLEDFRALVRRLQQQIPTAFEGGVVDIEVSLKAVPDPVHAGVFTLGECIPIEWSEGGAHLQSRIVLFYGSFAALARRLPGFDWREEAWQTLTHELRHHLEMRANVAALDLYDWAAEQNFARHERRPFDPAFYRSGDAIAPGVYKVEEDVFMEKAWDLGSGDRVDITWHGRGYRVPVNGIRPPAFVMLEGLLDEPQGEAVLVFPKRSSLRDLWHRAPVTQASVRARPVDA